MRTPAVPRPDGLAGYQVADMGDSMFVHAFGAYFGLAVSFVLYRPDSSDSANSGSSAVSDLFSMIGG